MAFQTFPSPGPRVLGEQHQVSVDALPDVSGKGEEFFSSRGYEVEPLGQSEPSLLSDLLVGDPLFLRIGESL